MALTISTYLNGISASICMSIGIIYGIYFIYLYLHVRKSLMPWIMLTAFAGGFLYFGPTASFFSLLITSHNLTPAQYGQFSYTAAAIGAFTGMYAGFSIFSPKLRKLMLWIYGVIGIVYLICLYSFPQIMISAAESSPNELLDISLKSVVLVISGFYILSFVFILSVGFFRLSRRIKESEERKHMFMLGFGWFMFGVAGIIDAMVPAVIIHLIVIARVLMAISFVLIYTGFSPPKLVQKEAIRIKKIAQR